MPRDCGGPRDARLPCADDLKRQGDTFEITCDPAHFSKVQEALQQNHITTEVAEITQMPKAPIDTDLETARKCLRLHEALEDHDDVQNVYFDVHLSDELMAEEAKS